MPHSVHEPRILICRNLPHSFPLGCLSRSGTPAVCHVTNGSSIVNAAREMNAVSLVLVGVESSDLDAPAICRALQDTPATAAIPVCVVGDNAAHHRRLDVLNAGASEFFEAPWDHEELALRLRRYWQASGQCLHGSAESPDQVAALGRQGILVWAAKQYLIQHQDSAPNQRELARLMGVPEGRLKAAFLDVLGVSVYEYLYRRNMTLALALLRDSQLRILDIAEMCGYSNAANFATAFRERTGMTPSAYRGRGRPEEGQRIMPAALRRKVHVSI